MNKEKKSVSDASKPESTAFLILFAVLIYINIISFIYNIEDVPADGTFRVVLMTVLSVASVIIMIAVFVLYFFKIVRIKSLKTPYLVLAFCCVGIVISTVIRGYDYMQDLAEGTSSVVTNDYWYYMGSGHVKFIDRNGNMQTVYVDNAIGETIVPLISSQFFSDSRFDESNGTANNKTSICIEYYPHSRTVADIHMTEQ